ncbi:uncharacterized protein B0H18DRAFT_617130 [Fomitopsis serialis]|uniref:uncharacterized protein n=1 Tax=Fomitopsis serialis TaxID=139415 RepID=UPI00200852E9|nr:uncharacterized protein B0H18DRAFT_617130 [Neoantrodia serialis]KAH9920086.1 hypothetical protein B0H18DRAFT_617130 [Neoantrodia serialis]
MMTGSRQAGLLDVSAGCSGCRMTSLDRNLEHGLKVGNLEARKYTRPRTLKVWSYAVYIRTGIASQILRQPRLQEPQHQLTMTEAPGTCTSCNLPLPTDAAQAQAQVAYFSCGHAYHRNRCIAADAEKCPRCQLNMTIGLTVAGAAIGVLLAPVVAPAALGLVGFSAAGPVAGTLAAAIQASIGNVAAGSLFAICQSVGMGGALPALGYAAGAVAGAVAGCCGCCRGNRRQH